MKQRKHQALPVKRSDALAAQKKASPLKVARGRYRVPLYLGSEPTLDEPYVQGRPQSVWEAIDEMPEADCRVVARECFDARPEDHWKYCKEAFLEVILETNRTEPGPEGTTLVWVDATGLVKIAIWA